MVRVKSTHAMGLIFLANVLDIIDNYNRKYHLYLFVKSMFNACGK